MMPNVGSLNIRGIPPLAASCSISSIVTMYCMDATGRKWSGRFGRLINHSSKASNCEVKVVRLGGNLSMVIFTKQEIEANTEFLIDYGDRNKHTLKIHPWLTY